MSSTVGKRNLSTIQQLVWAIAIQGSTRLKQAALQQLWGKVDYIGNQSFIWIDGATCFRCPVFRLWRNVHVCDFQRKREMKKLATLHFGEAELQQRRDAD